MLHLSQLFMALHAFYDYVNEFLQMLSFFH